jgi:hypothetical protein
MSQPDNYLQLYTNANDTGTNPKTVTINGSVSYTTISGRQCVYFNNNLNNFLTFPYSNPSQISIGYWIYVKDNGSYTATSISSPPYTSPIFQQDYYGTSVNYYARLPNYWTVNNAYPFSYIGKWIHICYVIDQSSYTVQFYVNGVIVNTGKGTGKFPSASVFLLGKSGDNGRAFNGYISEYFVYNRILSASEVQSIYSGNMLTSNSMSAVSSGTISQPDNYLELHVDATDTGVNSQAVTTNGSVTYTTIAGRPCAYFNNNINNYLSFKYTNPAQISIGYWLYTKDNNYYTTSSISSSPFVYDSPIFQADVGNHYIHLVAALPSKWTINSIYQANFVNNLTHVCYVMDQTNYTTQLYVNGNLAVSGKGTGKFAAANLFIIGKSGDNYRAFYGYISEYFVFNRILSASEVKSIYQGNMFASTGYNIGLQYNGYLNNTGFNNYNSATNFSIFNNKSNTSGVITTINCCNDTNLLYQTYGFNSNQYIALKFSGYFVPNITGKWGFILGNTGTNLPNDDLSYLWIGNNALNPNPSNYSGMVYYYSSFSQAYIYMNLTAGQYYPLLMYWGQSWGGFVVSLGLVLPNGSVTYDGTPYFKNGIAPTLQSSNFGKEYFNNMIEEEKVIKQISHKNNNYNMIKMIIISLIILIILYLLYKFLVNGKKK